MRKKKVRIQPFRILSVLLGLAVIAMLSRFPAKVVKLENQRADLHAAMEAYYAAQEKENRLNAECAQIGTAEFVERTARRDYGYSWYGETIYEVGNLAQIEAETEFEVYGES